MNHQLSGSSLADDASVRSDPPLLWDTQPAADPSPYQTDARDMNQKQIPTKPNVASG